MTARDTIQCPPTVTTETQCPEMAELLDELKKLAGAVLEEPPLRLMSALKSEVTANASIRFPHTETMPTW